MYVHGVQRTAINVNQHDQAQAKLSVLNSVSLDF